MDGECGGEGMGSEEGKEKEGKGWGVEVGNDNNQAD